jgi:type I restriction enzyme, S subunit
MDAEQLLQHFDRVAEATGSIAALRRFILDLAVRGKLVDQDPNDEPASELLKRIQVEKARLVKEGILKKGKQFLDVEKNEVNFNIPTNWRWVRIRQVTSDRGQTIPKSDFTYIDVTAINKELGYIADAKTLSASEAPSRARKLVQKNDVIYSCVRPYLLNIAIVDAEIIPPPIASTAFAILYGFDLVLPKYLWITLRSPFMIENVESKMRGQAYPAINDADFAFLPMPLPPLAEQHRIVAKVDELMDLCDRLEAAQKNRENLRDRLVAASLHQLNQAADSNEEFFDRARFYFDNLAKLSVRSEHIKQLRQTIISLAICGKLIPQDPIDEPVLKLLEKIELNKELLANSRGTKEQKKKHEIPANRIPYILPNTWRWISFAELIYYSDAGVSPRTEGFPRSGDQWGVVKVSFVSWDRFKPDENKQLFPEAKFPESAIILNGDFLISRANTSALVAKCVIVESQPQNLILSDKIVRLHLTEYCVARFVYFVNNYSLYARNYYASEASGTSDSMKNVSRPVIYSLPIPFPPLAEQHRIVAKIDELMTLCDRLESQINTTQSNSQKLLESLLNEALSETA